MCGSTGLWLAPAEGLNNIGINDDDSIAVQDGQVVVIAAGSDAEGIASSKTSALGVSGVI